MRAALLIVALVVVIAASLATARNGVDLAASYPTTTFQCLVQSSYKFIITRAYKPTGEPDGAAPINLNAANLAGIPGRDIYMSPCGNGATKSAKTQVREMMQSVGQGLEQWGTMWIQVRSYNSSEAPGACQWTSDAATNCQMLQQLIDAAFAMTVPTGIYSNAAEWNKVVGATCSVASSLPLWWASWDGQDSFSGFTPFGGWSSSNTRDWMKQTASSVNKCGVVGKADWYPM